MSGHAVLIDRLRTLFDPRRYRLFGDEFIRPRDRIGISGSADTEELFNLLILNPQRR